MSRSLKFFICIFFVLTSQLIANDSVNYKGTLHSFEKAEIYCQAEINPSNNIAILLTVLDKNSDTKKEMSFSKISCSKKEGLLLKGLLSIKEEDNSSTLQKISFKITPQQVETISLKGKKIYSYNRVKIFIQND